MSAEVLTDAAVGVEDRRRWLALAVIAYRRFTLATMPQ